MSAKIRIKDIAKEAGVSVGTVDRVLHNRGEVKASTKEKILKIADRLNYKPNIAAKVLKSSTSYKIAVLLPLPEGDNQYWSKHPIGIDNSLESVYPFTVHSRFFQFEIHNETDFNIKAASILDWKPDGVIIAPVLKKESQILCMQLDSLNIPYTFIDSNIDNTNCLSFIGEDAYQGGRVAASIMDLGINKDDDILIVNIAKNVDNNQHLSNRQLGFTSYFMDSGINTGKKINIIIPSTKPELVKSMLDNVFEQNPQIKGIMVSGSRTYAVAKYLQDSGKDQLFLIGYEVFGKNTYYLQQRVINFLISQRPIEQAEKAFKRLFDYLAFQTIPNKKELQPIDIINIENINLV